MKNNCLKYFVLAVFLGLLPQPVFAHGAKIKFRSLKAIEILATYDSGNPMAQAQVTVYAPNDPAQPWQKGLTDAQGKFIFTPDTKLTGNWQIKVRQSGHGGIVNIPLNPNTGESSQNLQQTDYTPIQKVLMAGLGVWGFVGTALFFYRSKTKNAHS